MDYVFTFWSWQGPCVKRFESAWAMLAFVSGWTLEHETVLVVNAREIRA